jgi:hypothetical protein
MSVLVVGSVALDSVETPFGKADEVLGGSGIFFSASASHLTRVQLVGVVGSDYPVDQLAPLAQRGVDLTGVERAEGESFRWRGRYRHDLKSAETLETRLGVFSHFRPKIPEQFRRPYVFLANIDRGCSWTCWQVDARSWWPAIPCFGIESRQRPDGAARARGCPPAQRW